MGKRRDWNIWIFTKVLKRRIFIFQFYLHFILFDMKLISITMKMTLYLSRKQLPTAQYPWESVKFPSTLAIAVIHNRKYLVTTYEIMLKG